MFSVALMQPIAADDVAAAMAEVALAEPLNDTVDVAGPEPIRMDELVRHHGRLWAITSITVITSTRELPVYFGTGGYDFRTAIPSLSAILTNSGREPAPIFSITWWR